MVKSTKAHQEDEEAVLVGHQQEENEEENNEEEEEEEDYDYDVVPMNNNNNNNNNSSSALLDRDRDRGNNNNNNNNNHNHNHNKQRSNKYRSKHSETEQRRRSKINERFQLLRNLIPQNDQRKDKASFLLEVIDYVKFLQEKVQIYEATTYQGSWNHEPTKLMPWRNHHGPAENFVDHSQDFKNASVQENNGAVTHPVLTTPHSVESCFLGPAGIYKTLDHLSGSTLLSDPISIQTLQDSVSDIENLTYQPESQLWQARSSFVQCGRNNVDMATEDGSATESTALSQGVLNTLTEVLQSSGVDLSQTHISVKLDVAKQANSGQMLESSSRDTEKQYLNDQVLPHRVVQSYNGDSDQARKRLRRD